MPLIVSYVQQTQYINFTSSFTASLEFMCEILYFPYIMLGKAEVG